MITVTIPVWLIVTVVALLPIGVFVATSGRETYMDFGMGSLISFGLTAITAGVCWTGLIVWWVMR